MTRAARAASRGRLVVVTTGDLAPGFRLAGVATVAAGSAAEAEDRLRELVDGAQERGVVAVHEPFLDALEPALRRHLEACPAPLVVALPAGLREHRHEDRRARLLRILAEAVGYEITFEQEGRRRA